LIPHVTDLNEAQTEKRALTLKPDPGEKRTWWAWIVGTACGAGFMKPGPGTYGSVCAVIVWFAVSRVVPYHWLPVVTLGMAALATAIGIPSATRVARESGRKDPQIVVIDEVAGQWLTLIFCLPQIPFALLGLLCFRVFDILKPPPVRQLERLPEGTGIIVDDLAAGVYGLIALTLLQQAIITWKMFLLAIHH